MKSVVIVLAAALLLSGCATTPPSPIAGPVAIAPAPAAPVKYGWGYTDKAKAEMAATFGTMAFRPAESHWISNIPASGPTKIVISLTDQLAWVYRGDRMIAATTISSGKTNVRAGPTLNSAIVAHFDPGAIVLVQRADSEWWRARPSKGMAFEGYIRQDRLVFK